MFYGKVLILFFMFFCAEARAAGFECFGASNLKYHKSNKEQSVERRFCFDAKSKLLLNEECSKKLDCKAMQSRVVSRKLLSQNHSTGNPAHIMCHILKGSPMIVKYKAGPVWRDGAICIFEDDSFVNMDYMMTYLITTL